MQWFDYPGSQPDGPHIESENSQAEARGLWVWGHPVLQILFQEQN
jgi:hypothetical protein